MMLAASISSFSHLHVLLCHVVRVVLVNVWLQITITNDTWEKVPVIWEYIWQYALPMKGNPYNQNEARRPYE
jgi:hypothetical protein